MLHGVRVLIADDEPFIAFALALSVQDARGEVIGPCGSVREAFDLIRCQGVPTAAILDVNLTDGEVTPVAEHLLDRSVHVIIHTGATVPALLRNRPHGPVVCTKPTAPEHLVRRLHEMIHPGRPA